VYRIGTLLELVREVATALAADGKRVKVCVQQAMGQGVFQGLPLSLNGVMRIMKQMDWGGSAGGPQRAEGRVEAQAGGRLRCRTHALQARAGRRHALSPPTCTDASAPVCRPDSDGQHGGGRGGERGCL
jgi:hypothetical protein